MIDLINKIVLHICYRCGEDECMRGIEHDCDGCILSEVVDEIKSINDKPHGRLIDADKLCEVLNEKKIPVDSRVNYEIVNAPTVSAAKKLNNQIHLCDSCKYNYPNCPSENEDVLFGNGVGNDNICCCAKYLVSVEAEEHRIYQAGYKTGKLHARDYKWIPCSERLPEYMKTVIISTFWGVKTGYLDSTEAYGDFWEIIEDDGDTALHNVYAWMPLPKPYREDGEV